MSKRDIALDLYNTFKGGRKNFVLKNKTDGGAFKDTMQNLRSKAIGKFDSLKNAVKNIKLTEKPLSYVAGETEINQLNENELGLVYDSRSSETKSNINCEDILKLKKFNLSFMDSDIIFLLNP